MRKLTTRLRTWGLMGLCVAVIGVGAAAGAAHVAKQYFVQGPSASQIFLMPGGNAKFNSNIARLDTRTGAVYRFRGDVGNPSVRNTWELRVPAVKGEHSAILEIQTPFTGLANPELDALAGRTTFLVDVVTGQTWILRHRASSNATWDPVDTFKHSNYGS